MTTRNSPSNVGTNGSHRGSLPGCHLPLSTRHCISNRHSPELEFTLTSSKRTITSLSNGHISRVTSSGNSPVTRKAKKSLIATVPNSEFAPNPLASMTSPFSNRNKNAVPARVAHPRLTPWSLVGRRVSLQPCFWNRDFSSFTGHGKGRREPSKDSNSRRKSNRSETSPWREIFRAHRGRARRIRRASSFVHVHEDAARLDLRRTVQAFRKFLGALTREASERVLRKIAWHRISWRRPEN